MRNAVAMVVLILLGFSSTAATGDDAVEIKVERSKIDTPDLPSLRFLKDNRDFLRSQLDRLKQVEQRREFQAQALSARDLLYRRLAAEIAAGSDSLATARSLAAQRELLRSVSGLGELERELDALEQMLLAQRDRFQLIENDYVGRQETALLVLLNGFPQGEAPDALVLVEAGEAEWRIELSDAQKESLRHGGAARLVYEFVEPRNTILQMSFEGAAFALTPPLQLEIDPMRDRLNMLEIDLSGLLANAKTPDVSSRSWAR
jgi:hypothetical protein